ncbi:MAG: endonuclease/exonuclease/phosphatase family protein [Anaerolineae bacterium]
MKIVTLNLRHDADRWSERYPLVVKALARQNADVIAFQEVAIPIRQAHMIAAELNGEQPYAVHVQPKWGNQGHEGIAVLTRLAATVVEGLNLPHGSRVAQRVRVIIDGQAVNIINTHLHHEPENDESIRAPQARAILQWINRCAEQADNQRWVLLGDFNAQPHSETIQHIAESFQSAYAMCHSMEPLTFPTPLVADETYPPMAIDYIFFNPSGFEVLNAHMIGTKAADHDPTLYPSDHFGLAAELRLK